MTVLLTHIINTHQKQQRRCSPSVSRQNWTGKVLIYSLLFLCLSSWCQIHLFLVVFHNICFQRIGNQDLQMAKKKKSQFLLTKKIPFQIYHPSILQSFSVKVIFRRVEVGGAVSLSQSSGKVLQKELKSLSCSLSVFSLTPCSLWTGAFCCCLTRHCNEALAREAWNPQRFTVNPSPLCTLMSAPLSSVFALSHRFLHFAPSLHTSSPSQCLTGQIDGSSLPISETDRTESPGLINTQPKPLLLAAVL